ncbi:MAG: serine/threonine protein kinase [Deltaproteobacteria bacterium]|nr:serine/threonine protein kinase [Deltaproteobacteria bacterium]
MEVAIIFGMPVLIVGLVKYFSYRTRRLELEHGGTNQLDKQRIATLLEDRKLLEGRVQNLETIVTSVDLELNTRLNRLAASQSQLLLSEGPRPTSTAGVALGPVAQGAAQEPMDAPVDRALAATAFAAPLGHLQSGATLARRFEVKELLGSGGMGAVYRAHDRELGEDVALKTISANLAEDPEAVSRFRREVGAARKITHRNVIRIHDLGEDEGMLFLSMEYFQGITLQEVITQRGQLSYAEALPLIEQIADALDAAHGAGVIHRDLKPLNVLVNERQDVRVIDFGLAKASTMRAMTATGVLMGTVEYMSPEQVRGVGADERSDVYALAAIAFHMLCGRPPFEGENVISVGFMQCNDAPPHPRELAPALPEHVDQAILRGLAKDPNARFASAALFRDAVRGLKV